MLKQVGEYEVKETLGEGAFGVVRKVMHTPSKTEFAMKMLDKEKLRAEDLGKALKNEVKLMKLIQHPNVVHLHEVLSSKSKLFMVLELIRGGDLFDHLVKKDILNEDESRNIF
jgi:serine/threonine protein kinase